MRQAGGGRVPTWVWFDLPFGLVIAVFGLGEATSQGLGYLTDKTLTQCLVAVGMGAAVALHRRSPSTALGVVWATCVLQVLSLIDLMFVDFALVIVAYGVARYGSLATLWASLFSIPAGYVIGIAYVPTRSKDVLNYLGISRLPYAGVRPVLVLTVTAAAPFVLPWLVGFAMRMRDRAVASRAESAREEMARIVAEEQRAQAQRLAVLREEQTRLARDVHDVVGHSLAVILAQAESGHYLPDEDPARLKQTMENIATSARKSLQDVRQILATTGGSNEPAAGGADPAGAAASVGGTAGAAAGADATSDPVRAGDLGQLIDDVREAGVAIHTSVVGTDRPLPPDLAVVAYRVLQEMLTNTIKHGRAGEPVQVVRRWEDGLTIEVTNTSSAAAGDQPAAATPRQEAGGRHGVEGMRQRLAGIGGTLSITQVADTYTASAWLPTAGRTTRCVARVDAGTQS